MPQIQKESVRKRIMKEARAAFLVSGYQNTSMRQIAQKSEMTVGNLYRYFENKASLFGAIVDPFLTEIDKVLKETTQDWVGLHTSPEGIFEVSGNGYREAVEKMIRFLVRTIRKHRVESILVLSKSQGYHYGDTIQDTVGWIYAIFEERERTKGAPFNPLFTKAIAKGFLESLIVMIQESKSDEEAEAVLTQLINHYFLLPVDRA